MKSHMESDGMHIEKLKPTKPIVINPLLPIVEELMSTYLNGHNWKQYTVTEIRMKIKELLLEKEIPLTERHYISLDKKLQKVDSTEKCLSILEKVLFPERI